MAKTKVELLYFPDCPNVPAARAQLRRAFEVIGASPKWTEIDVSSNGAPAQSRGYGSPSILVDGKDVTGAAPGDGASCRIYAGSGVRGAPPLESIVAALQTSSPPPASASAASNLAIVPGALLSVLPVVSCPSCWPAYAGVLSSMGVAFLMDTAWLLPLTAGALMIALGCLAFRARRRRGFGPLALGAVAAVAVMLGKFALELNAAVYAGTALLVGASVWNSWPKKQPPPCDACSASRGIANAL